MAGTGEEFGPCPFCGKLHTEDVLLCPDSEKLLPLEGRMLDGKFRFTRQLGEGGMGAVWKAENVLVKKDVAIKLMHVQFSRDEGVLARFRNEATAAGRIGSDHICDILDLGKSALGPYIVMEMLKGKDFANFLQEMHGRVDPGLSVLIVREALIGLQAAHDVGIVHRDLKPENIFLHEPKKGRLMVKLMDFGISKFTEGSEAGKTGMGVLMGTPEYMSPEQTEGAAQVDHRTDIWAMGVILYWALTGKNPFAGPTMAATLVNVSTKPPPPLQQVAPHVDPNLVAIIDRCMAKSPDQRFGSCDELSQALAPYENRDNGIYVVAGGRPAGPPKPGATVASAPSNPPPGATVASAHTPMPGPSQTPPPGSPTFGSNPSGNSGSPTWTGSVSGPPGSAPTIGTGAGSFGGIETDFDARPDSNIGGGKGLLIGLVLLLVAGAGVGGYFVFGPGKSGGDKVAKSDDGGGDDGSKAAADGDGAADDGKADEAADEGKAAAEGDADAAEAGEDGAASGGSGGVAVAADAGAEGGDAAAEGGDAAAEGGDAAAEGGDDAADGGDDGGKADGGGDDGGKADAGGDDGGGDDGGKADGGGDDGGKADGGGDDGGKSDGGGDGGGKPQPTGPSFDKSKVKKVGNLYVQKRAGPRVSQIKSRSSCPSKYGGIKKWRLPSSSEIKKIKAPTPGSGAYWVSDRGKVYDVRRKAAVKAGPRKMANVICVSKNR